MGLWTWPEWGHRTQRGSDGVLGHNRQTPLYLLLGGWWRSVGLIEAQPEKQHGGANFVTNSVTKKKLSTGSALFLFSYKNGVEAGGRFWLFFVPEQRYGG